MNIYSNIRKEENNPHIIVVEVLEKITNGVPILRW